jgi:hypothetical protein
MLGLCCGNAEQQAGGRNYAVIGSENSGPQPADPICFMTFVMCHSVLSGQ